MQYSRIHTVFLLIALLLSSMLFILSFWGVKSVEEKETSESSSSGSIGDTGASVTTGPTGLTGATGPAGSFATSGYHEHVVCMKKNGEFDRLKDFHGGSGTCPENDSEEVMIFKDH